VEGVWGNREVPPTATQDRARVPAAEAPFGSVPGHRYDRPESEGGPRTVEHLVFRWSPTGYTLDIRPGEPPLPGGLVAEGEQRYRVTKVAPSPLPEDGRACAYLLPVASWNGGGHVEVEHHAEPTPVWTEPRDDLAVLFDSLPQGSCIVAADAEGRRVGLTVDSLRTLSLDPPLVGFACASDSMMREVLQDAGGCAITVLAGGQQWLADHFAGGARPIAMWHGLASESGAVGAPLFVGALGWLECSLLDWVELGALTLFVCAVRRVEAGTEAPALLRVRGSYGAV
jgi:flavin reductase (DIM6/NTAB) family NADH-FMN oxidoreductase RutF